MQGKIIILALYIVTSHSLLANYCSCNEITIKDDCQNNPKCQWSSVNNVYSCSTFQMAELICTEYTDQSSCDEATACAWTNGGSCQNFLQHCSYYTLTAAQAYLCQKKNSTCIPGTLTNGQVTCTEGTLQCSDIKDQSICTGLLTPSQYSYCYWESSCKTLDYSQCSNLSSSMICMFYGCIWNNNSCGAYTTCSEINSKETCTSIIRANSIQQAQLCQWENNICVDLDPTIFTQPKCFSQSQGTYTWNGLRCTACIGSSSSQSYLVILYLVMYIFES